MSWTDLHSEKRLSYHIVVNATSEIYAGEIIATRSFFNTDSSSVQTANVYRVDLTIKGAQRDTLIITTPGGTIGDRVFGRTYAPSLEIGDRFVYLVSIWEIGTAYLPGQRVIEGFWTTARFDLNAISHMRAIVRGENVSPVAWRTYDFETPTGVDASPWATLKIQAARFKGSVR